MKGQIICLLVLNLIFIWGGANGSDAFEDVAKNLMEKSTQRLEASEHKKRDPYVPFQSNPEAYAEQFKHFLQTFNSGDSAISEEFNKLGFYAWEGHYITKVYLNASLRKQISLHSTPFQDIHSDIIDSKNIIFIRNAVAHFSNWTSLMLVQTQATPDRNMETIRVILTEVLLALEDTKAPSFKEFEIFLVYFYQILKRLRGAEVIHQDPFISEEFLRLSNKYFHGVEIINNEATSTCCCAEKGGISGHVKTKLKLLQHKKKVHLKFISTNFDDVSNEFKNLYYSIFEQAPVKFDIKSIKDQFNVYYLSYYREKQRDLDFRSVQIGQVFLNQLFTENPTLYKLDTYPPA
ncbi:uncharacterized protein LOC116341088 [Contarinia nasturtii]|uniref:uncharacterized protein LOC116341088 n=1 Tax=Contarinia nasturtii TaxID=265458 RepID=UPI0012D3ABAC|nr:uncharacterized protein LOC116341088 [Contarinia nasturtii]